jgi:hypothetical protein
VVFGRYVILLDMKRHDMHVVAEARETGARLLDLIGEKEVAQVLRTDDWKDYNCRIQNTRIRASIKGTQPSGTGDTSISNSIEVHVILEEVDRTWNGGDADALMNHVVMTSADLGFLAQAELVDSVRDPLEVEYLQQRFYLVAGESTIRVPGNRIGRILLRTFWTKDRLKPHKNLGLMRGIALSLYKQNNHVPILNDLFRAILEKTEGVRVYYDKDWKRKMMFLTPDCDRVLHEEHPATELELAEALDVSLGQIQALRLEMRKVDLGAHLAVGPEFKELVDKLAKWDL